MWIGSVSAERPQVALPIFLTFPFCKYGTDPANFLQPCQLINKGLHFFFLTLNWWFTDFNNTGSQWYKTLIEKNLQLPLFTSHDCTIFILCHTQMFFRGANRDWHCLGCSSSFRGKQVNTHFFMPSQRSTHSNPTPNHISKASSFEFQWPSCVPLWPLKGHLTPRNSSTSYRCLMWAWDYFLQFSSVLECWWNLHVYRQLASYRPICSCCWSFTWSPNYSQS